MGRPPSLREGRKGGDGQEPPFPTRKQWRYCSYWNFKCKLVVHLHALCPSGTGGGTLNGRAHGNYPRAR